jgi:hypothetical protein
MDCAALLQYMAFYRIGLIKRIQELLFPVEQQCNG